MTLKTPKEIGRRSGKIFRNSIPDNIAERDQQTQEDYGIDYEFEVITPEDKPTGIIFKVQQKGTEDLDIIQNGRLISYRELTIEKARYYLNLDIPAIFVIVGTKKQRSYWVALQGNLQLINAVNEAELAQGKTVTIHIPTKNVLPETFDDLLQSVSDIHDYLITKEIRKLTSQRIFAAANRTDTFDSLGQAVHRHYDFYRNEELESLIRQERREDVLKRCRDILNSPSESIELRFAAGINIVRVTGVMLEQDRDASLSRQWLEMRSDIYLTLLTIVRSPDAPIELRNFTKFLLRSVRLAKFVEHDWGLFLNHQIHQQAENDFSHSLLNIARQASAIKVLREFHKAQNALIRLLSEKGDHLLAQAWARLVMDGLKFLHRLREDGFREAEAQLTHWLLLVGNFALKTALQYKQWSDIMLCVVPKLSLAAQNSEEEYLSSYEEMREAIEQIDDEETRQEEIEWLEECYKLYLTQGTSRELSTIDEEIYKQMARSLGIDPDNPKNIVDRIVQIGLRDLNPERILKHCKHLFVSPGPHGVPAEILKLPTAGFKWLHCTKHDYSLSAMSLEDLYQTFHHLHCKSCKDSAPRHQGWKWDQAWQGEQHNRFKDFVEKSKLIDKGMYNAEQAK